MNVPKDDVLSFSSQDPVSVLGVKKMTLVFGFARRRPTSPIMPGNLGLYHQIKYQNTII